MGTTSVVRHICNLGTRDSHEWREVKRFMCGAAKASDRHRVCSADSTNRLPVPVFARFLQFESFLIWLCFGLNFTPFGTATYKLSALYAVPRKRGTGTEFASKSHRSHRPQGQPPIFESPRRHESAEIAAKFVLDFSPPSRYARIHATRRSDRHQRQCTTSRIRQASRGSTLSKLEALLNKRLRPLPIAARAKRGRPTRGGSRGPL